MLCIFGCSSQLSSISHVFRICSEYFAHFRSPHNFSACVSHMFYICSVLFSQCCAYLAHFRPPQTCAAFVSHFCRICFTILSSEKRIVFRICCAFHIYCAYVRASKTHIFPYSKFPNMTLCSHTLGVTILNTMDIDTEIRLMPIPNTINLKASPLPPAPLEVKWLRRSEDQRNRSCCHRGLSRGHLVSSWAVFGPSWGHLRAVLGCFRAFFGASWGQLGPSWAGLRAILGHLGVNFAIFGYHLGGFGGRHTRFGGSWPVSESCPTRFGGPGRFLKDVSHGLGGPVGRQSKATRARRGFEGGFWGPGGNQTREQKVEDLWVRG
jgi:hypothetical protein